MKKFIIISVVISIFLGIIYYSLYRRQNTISMHDALNYYGFTTIDQKKAIEDLLHKGGIISVNQSLEQAFPNRSKESELVQDLLTFVKELQNKFVIRTGKQERWEVSAVDWMVQNKNQLLEDLKVLGFVDDIPAIKTTDAICILGGARSRMLNRLEYANSLLENGVESKAIILLSGERYLTKNIDGNEEELQGLSKKFALDDWSKLTEMHLLKDLYNSSLLYNKSINTYFIDTPSRDLPRPTTETTILELISWLKSHSEVQSIIFISNQPYVKYQEAIISAIFKENGINIKYQVVGSSAILEKDNIQPILEGFGTYIFAALPTILSNMNININDPLVNNVFKELYSKNPLIYRSLPSNFR